MKIRLLLPADEEFAEAALYYYDESPQTARRFKRVVEESLRAIGATPKRFRRYGRTTRVKVVRGFPYSIFYTFDSEEVIVAAIAHDAQEPGYWESRL